MGQGTEEDTQGTAQEGGASFASLRPTLGQKVRTRKPPDLDVLIHQGTTHSVTPRGSAGDRCSDKSQNITKNQSLSREKLWSVKVMFPHTHTRDPSPGTEGPRNLEPSRVVPL